MPTNLNNLKSKVYKLDVDKLVPVSVDLSKLSGEKMLLKKMYIKIGSKILKIKYLVLQTWLIILLLMLK